MGVFPRVVDADLDGRKDLLVGDAEGELILYMNVNTDSQPLFDGGTALEAGPEGSREIIDVGQRPAPFVVDWDGDGKRDILVGAKDGLLRLFINKGSDSAWDLSAGAALQDGGSDLVVPSLRPSPHVEDLDGDGRKDMIIGNTEGEILFYPGTDGGSSPSFGAYEYVFAGEARLDLPGLPRSRPFICQWDDDGVPDMLVGSADGTIRLYRGMEDRTTGTGHEIPHVAAGFLHPLFPNPFNPVVNVPVEMPAAGRARVEVLDARGARVAIVADRLLAGGYHGLVWDGRRESGDEAASGIYFMRLVTDGGVSVRKAVLVR